MHQSDIHIYTLSIVFLGDFNPIIIQPLWLSNKKLIREQEGIDAKVDIIHPDLVRFNIDWASIEITKQRFEIRSSKDVYFEPMKDLAISIFNILRETPIRALGINHLMHFSLQDESKYYAFGNKLAPLNNWDGILNNPRLFGIEIIDNIRKDGLVGYYRIKVEASDVLKKEQYGVMFNLNDHYGNNSDHKKSEGSLEMINILKNNWEESNSNAKKIVDNTFEKISI